MKTKITIENLLLENQKLKDEINILRQKIMILQDTIHTLNEKENFIENDLVEEEIDNSYEYDDFFYYD
jgi:prefoldin subunit 5